MNPELAVLAAVLLVGVVYLWWPASTRIRRVARSGCDSTFGVTPLERIATIARAQFLSTKNAVTRRRTYEARRSASIEFLSALSAELSVGQPLTTAFERAAASIPMVVCPLSRSAARFGGDLAEALRQDAETEKLPSLRALSALWQVSEESGASLATSVGRIATAQLASEEIRGTLQAELAGPKATAKVLAGLPVLGMILGASLGGDPVGWLTGSIWGIGVLVVGVGLEALGIFWVTRMMRSVERRL